LSRTFFVALLAFVVALQPALGLQATDFATDTSALVCKVRGLDGKPLRGVRVRAYHLSSERLYVSEPTGSKGRCSLKDLPYGYHDLAVETPEGLYIATQTVNIPPDSTSAVELTLLGGPGGETVRAFPGSELRSAGLAQMDEQLRGRAFWKSPRGIAIIAGAAGLLLLLMAGGGGGGGPSNETDALDP